MGKPSFLLRFILKYLTNYLPQTTDYKYNNVKVLTASLLFLLTTSVFGQDPGDKFSNEEFYEITEAYLTKGDFVLNLTDSYRERQSYLFFFTESDTIYMGISHQFIDSLVYIGYMQKIENPGFETKRKDSEFYQWSYESPGSDSIEKAWVMKEYITGSLKKRDQKYYFFHIVNIAQNYEYQIYGYKIKI